MQEGLDGGVQWYNILTSTEWLSLVCVWHLELCASPALPRALYSALNAQNGKFGTNTKPYHWCCRNPWCDFLIPTGNTISPQRCVFPIKTGCVPEDGRVVSINRHFRTLACIDSESERASSLWRWDRKTHTEKRSPFSSHGFRRFVLWNGSWCVVSLIYQRICRSVDA